MSKTKTRKADVRVVRIPACDPILLQLDLAMKTREGAVRLAEDLDKHFVGLRHG